MNLIGMTVEHKTLGIGTVVNYTSSYIYVSFGERTVTFQFPSAFQTFLRVTDSTLLPTFDDFLESCRREKLQEENKIQLRAKASEQKREQHIQEVRRKRQEKARELERRRIALKQRKKWEEKEARYAQERKKLQELIARRLQAEQEEKDRHWHEDAEARRIERERERKLREEQARRQRELKEQEERKKADEEKAYRRQLLRILDEHGFEGFLHTTEFENFCEIAKKGRLTPRAILEERNSFFTDRANSEIISRTSTDIKGCCRFYYFFKTPTNYSAKYRRPVILVFKKEVIMGHTVRFADGNAKSHTTTITASAKEALSFNWDEIFRRGWQAGEELPSENKRIRNAEFLIPAEVPIRFISKIYFKNSSDLQEAKELYPELCEKFECNRGKFF